jgi:hypothetical protein
VISQPAINLIAIIYTQVIKNQKDFVASIADKPLKEFEKYLCFHGVFKDHKVNFPQIAK